MLLLPTAQTIDPEVKMLDGLLSGLSGNLTSVHLGGALCIAASIACSLGHALFALSFEEKMRSMTVNDANDDGRRNERCNCGRHHSECNYNNQPTAEKFRDAWGREQCDQKRSIY